MSEQCQHVPENDDDEFSSDITPIILAAHVNNYEILKILLSEGTTLIRPHDIRCGCTECITKMAKDSLRFSRSRLNLYRALACPYLIALRYLSLKTSDDLFRFSSEYPLRTAFKLSYELKELSHIENEFRSDYEKLSDQCEIFAKELLDQARSTQELSTILYYSDESDAISQDGVLATLKLAVHFNQKEFVAQPNCQQLLSTLWYDGVYGWRRMHWGLKVIYSGLIGCSWPLFCLLYIILPKTKMGKWITRPFMKFIVGTASYLTFLLLLVLASQIKSVGSGDDPGPAPSTIEWILLPWIMSLIFSEIGQLWMGGASDYVKDRWNVMDFFMNSLYLATISTKVCAYVIHMDIEKSEKLVRSEWDPLHPTLISEALFAIANIFSFMRLSESFFNFVFSIDFSLLVQFKRSYGSTANFTRPYAVRYFQVPFHILPGFICFCKWT